MSEYIYEARKRIRQIRMTDVEITVLKDGKPAENAAVSLRMKNHQFCSALFATPMESWGIQGGRNALPGNSRN